MGLGGLGKSGKSGDIYGALGSLGNLGGLEVWDCLEGRGQSRGFCRALRRSRICRRFGMSAEI